jgi:hypothetical protein
MDDLQPSDENAAEHVSHQAESARGLIQVCLRCPPELRVAKIREYLGSDAEEQRLMVYASQMVQVWKPFGAQDAWNVLWRGPLVMGRAQYCLQLESRLRELIAEDPREAKDILTGSPEWNPDLYQIGLYNNPNDWARLITECDQVRMFLNRIDWSKPGETQRLVRGHLPSFADICATIPS